MSEATNLEKAVFGQAMELPPEQREAFLEAACKGNSHLRRQVEELLAAFQDAGKVLGASAATTDGSQIKEGPGTVIGR